MSVKEQVSRMLEENKEKFISGEEIAETLGVTRSSVWKAIKALEKVGCEIEAVPHKGYRISGNCDILTAETVSKYLRGDNGITLDIRRNVPSTNTVLRKMAENGAPEGTVLISAEQSEGRGRMGRRFESPLSGLYMSILLRPKIAASEALMITTAAAVATARAVENVSGRKAGIKWVNDIFCGGKKICGILTEAAFGLEGGCFDHAVCGIGVNVNMPENGFPPELRDIAGAVFSGETAAVPNPRAKIAAEIINNFFDIYHNDLEKKDFIDEYIARSVVIGKNVFLIRGGESVSARVCGIDRECRLDVCMPDGTLRKVSSGEISLRLNEQ